MGLLDVAGLHHVAVAACKDQRYATNRYSMDAAFDWAPVIEQLAVDVATANKLLPANKQVREATKSMMKSMMKLMMKSII